MAKRPTSSSSTPSDFPQVTPPDLYATSDIRFVMLEIGKLTAKVDRLVDDVGSHGDKIDDLKHQSSFVKGVVAASTAFLTLIIGLATFFLSQKWDAAIQALSAFRNAG